MKTTKTILAFLFCSVSLLIAGDHPQLKSFPKEMEGKERFVIVLPEKARGEDDAFKVELIVGKEMETDGVNRVSLGGDIKPTNLEGWGYTYYVVDNPGPGRSTLIGVPPGAPKVRQFVTMPSKMIRYNSRLPIVIFVPKGYEVRYRIWQQGELMNGEKG